MSIIDSVRRVLPPKYRQFAKFLVVGGTTWVIDTGLFFFLKHTVLPEKVLTAKIIAILVAMIVNYVLNREWSFNDRGGRERHHEAALFFLLNGIGIVVNLAPLWISHYLLGFNAQNYTPFTETVADFISGSIIGTVVAMAFRYWAYQKWVFPELVEEGVAAGEAPVLENELTFNIPPHLHPHTDVPATPPAGPDTPPR
jgi:putative flippase GtrA